MLEKLLSFEYVLKCLLEWHKEQSHSEQNDISILKALKLLFFVSAAKAAKESENILLNNVFNRYFAMPYGHVESDILNIIKNHDGELNYYIINNTNTTPKIGVNLDEISSDLDILVKKEIDDSVSFLREKNSSLILMSQFDLVNLSHVWYSWQHYYKKALQSGTRSILIPTLTIIEEDKIFSLQSF